MDTTLIKKELYKQKPIAELGFENEEFKTYSCELVLDGVEEIINFEIPKSDCAESLTDKIEAHLLIRWLV